MQRWEYAYYRNSAGGIEYVLFGVPLDEAAWERITSRFAGHIKKESTRSRVVLEKRVYDPMEVVAFLGGGAWEMVSYTASGQDVVYHFKRPLA